MGLTLQINRRVISAKWWLWACHFQGGSLDNQSIHNESDNQLRGYPPLVPGLSAKSGIIGENQRVMDVSLTQVCSEWNQAITAYVLVQDIAEVWRTEVVYSVSKTLYVTSDISKASTYAKTEIVRFQSIENYNYKYYLHKHVIID